MNKPDRHGTYKQRQYSGELETETLIPWLNEAHNDAGRRRLCQVLEIYDEFRSEVTLLRPMATRVGQHRNPFSSPPKRRPSVGRLEKLLYRYKYYPMLFPHGPMRV